MNEKDSKTRLSKKDDASFLASGVFKYTFGKINSGLLVDTIKGFTQKYVCNLRYYMYDSFEVSFASKDIGVGHYVPSIIPALFPDRVKSIKRDNGVVIWCGFDCGNYVRRLDAKTIAIMNVSTDFAERNQASSESFPNGTKYRQYSIWIIGANCNKWCKKLYIRSIKAETAEKLSPENIKNGVLSILNCIYQTRIITTKVLSDMVLDKNMHYEITSAIDNFIANRDTYTKHGLPYRLGILLYGPTGSGKSAYIKALALKYKREIHYIDRDAVYDDDLLVYSDSSYTTSTKFYVIEEIDTFLEVRNGEREKNLGKEMITKFIDSLDNGHIIFATTNYRDKIIDAEPAIIRPGRFSIHKEMGYFQREQANEMATKMGLDDLSFLDELKYPICPTELEFICTQRLFESVQKMKN